MSYDKENYAAPRARTTSPQNLSDFNIGGVGASSCQYCPTLEQIQEGCLEIQATWDAAEFLKRAVEKPTLPVEIELPTRLSGRVFRGKETRSDYS